MLEAAAGILAVEAYHAGEIRTILYSLGLFRPAQLVSDARDSLDSPEDKDQGIGNRNEANIVLADENAIAFSRSPTEVLNIVYLNGQTQPGVLPERRQWRHRVASAQPGGSPPARLPRASRRHAGLAAVFRSKPSSAACAGVSPVPAASSFRPAMWSLGRLTESIASSRPPLK